MCPHCEHMLAMRADRVSSRPAVSTARFMAGPSIHLAALDVQRGYERRFEDRFWSVFVPEILAGREVDRIRIYECLDGEPSRLCLYYLSASAPSARALPAPIKDAELGRRLRNYHARTYRESFAAGCDPQTSELINVISVDIASAHAAAFNRWYNETHVPEILDCPGWAGARRYESLDGDPRFLAIYALEDPLTPFQSPQYEAAVGWDDFRDVLRGYHGFRIYRLIDEARR
jgi:hypothetical protein